MALKSRYTEQLPVQMTPDMRAELERIHETDPAAPSLAAAARTLLELGLAAYREQKA